MERILGFTSPDDLMESTVSKWNRMEFERSAGTCNTRIRSYKVDYLDLARKVPTSSLVGFRIPLRASGVSFFGPSLPYMFQNVLLRPYFPMHFFSSYIWYWHACDASGIATWHEKSSVAGM